jgi:hypothetical protein
MQIVKILMLQLRQAYVTLAVLQGVNSFHSRLLSSTGSLYFAVM